MKKIYFLLVLAGLVSFSACKKQLDQQPISSPTASSFYTIPNDFIQGVNAVYNDLRTYPDRQLNLSETRSDNLYAVSEGGVRDWDPVNDFSKTLAGNPYVQEAWSTNFNGIYRANVVLEQLRLRGDSIITDVNLRNRLQAEARFLRAFYYFDLVRYFGKVPIVTRPLSPAESLTVARSSVDSVYNLILSDLKFAVDNLPATYSASADLGRATKWAAKGILALVYMTRSGPTYGIEGPGRGVNEWGLAQTQLNDIIASRQFALDSSYARIFSYTNENNREVIFDVQYISGINPVLGGTFPWVLVPDAYFQSQGKPVQGGLTIRPVSNDLLSSYEPGDIRRSVTIQTGYTFQGVPESRSFIKKYVDLTRVPANRVDWPINFIVLRYTDVQLLKAENILHGAPGTQFDVDTIVNKVRARAGLGPVSNVTLPQLMEERRKEFAGEGLRWHDLVRSGLVVTVMNNWINKEDVQHQITRPFNVNYIIYPVPQGELDVRQGLYQQNPDY